MKFNTLVTALLENYHPSLYEGWMGIVDSNGAVKFHHIMTDECVSHIEKWGNHGNRWYYMDQEENMFEFPINTVMWWQSPSDEEKMALENWVWRKFKATPKHQMTVDDTMDA